MYVTADNRNFSGLAGNLHSRDGTMKMFVEVLAIYLYSGYVNFRKSINGQLLIIEQDMAHSPFDEALLVFCNRHHDKVKALYWDKTGFCLWYKRLEQDFFRWPAAS
ncbi:IS66 family insertion sequence element accessory protein TnpB [Arsenophonus endosymbiont of Aleurodicus floccissimus]|uniref:IS66 family insertion sequence element accessory protein TnpB n=1 Tax=Arsenophonus endosymbiont of Aleurodicus floccissimus TaxID=2152761 RepID=UPI0011C3EB2C|nr:IS66 family insertion sequence element accessory protein TnpB [Arsenophonus endosymbiont of Aleurodicus floccissimus]